MQGPPTNGAMRDFHIKGRCRYFTIGNHRKLNWDSHRTNISKLLFRKWCNKYWRSLCCNMRWSIKEHLQTPSVSIYTETDALYIHIQVSPPTLDISCPVPHWPMPELQNCHNIISRIKRIGGNLESGLAFFKSHNFRAFIIYDEFKRTSVQFPKERQCLNAHL